MMAKGRGVEPRLQVLETRLLAGAPSNMGFKLVFVYKFIEKNLHTLYSYDLDCELACYIRLIWMEPTVAPRKSWLLHVYAYMVGGWLF